MAASRKIRRTWMKRHRVNTAVVSLQRGDACRSTAIRVQQPQLGGPVIAASRKIRRRWMKRHRVNTAAVSSQRGDACRIRVLQPNKMPPRNNRGRVSRFTWRADQLLHKQRAQTTSAHHSKPLRHTDAHEYRAPMQRSGPHCTATRHSFEILRVDSGSKRIHGMRQKLGDEPGARALPAAARDIGISGVLRPIVFL